jgi:prepilin-type N-terminal cleavage/methylation domain-containing protein
MAQFKTVSCRSNRKAFRSSAGFTLIELIMVILLVAILAVVAIPQFIDYREEAKNAATTNILGTLRTGIALQYTQAMLRCNGTAGVWPSLTALDGNDMTLTAPCNSGQITTPAEAKFIAQPTIPQNPWGVSNSVNACAPATCAAHCNLNGCDDAGGVAPGQGGWCYDAATGAIWADSTANLNTNECSF